MQFHSKGFSVNGLICLDNFWRNTDPYERHMHVRILCFLPSPWDGDFRMTLRTDIAWKIKWTHAICGVLFDTAPVDLYFLAELGKEA